MTDMKSIFNPGRTKGPNKSDSSDKTRHVLITNANSRIAYVALKSLATRGIKVSTSDFVRTALSFFSKYSHNHFVYDSPYSKPMQFIDSLITNIRQYDYQVLLPVHEETFLIAKHKETLSKFIKLPIPDYRSILLAHNKDKLLEIATKLGIPVPRTYKIKTIEDIVPLSNELRYPVILKPRQGGGNFGINYVYSRNHLRQAYAHSLTRNGLTCERLLIQECIPVAEKFSQVQIFNQGNFRVKFTDKHLRDFPPTGGAGCFRVSTSYTEIEEYSKRLLEHLCWHGVAEVEYVTHRETGKPYLIELNPRLWGGLNSAVASGVDIPYLLYKLAIDGDIDTVKDYKLGVKTRWLWGDIRVFWHYMKSQNSKPRTLFEYIDPTVSCDDFSLLDPLPFLVWPLNVCIKIAKYRTLNPVTYDSLKGEWE